MSQRALDYSAPKSRTNSIASRFAKRVLRMLPYLFSGIAFYFGSYACLSAFGRFQPGSIGANGVKSYRWSPAGFHSGYRQRWALYQCFLPLYLLDREYWHRECDAGVGKYPTTPSTPAEWAEWKQ
jgi:hypothetical protein